MSGNVNLVTYVKSKGDDVYTDHYEVFEHLPDAHRRYEALCKEEDTWSANVSRVIRSTDYNLPVQIVEHRPALQQKWKDRGIKSPNQS